MRKSSCSFFVTTLAIARRALVLNLPRPTALWALDIELHPTAHLRHLSRPMALRALYTSARSRLPLARRTSLLTRNLQPRHPAAHRRPEVHTHLVLQVSPRPRPARRLLPAIEHPAKDILEASTKNPPPPLCSCAPPPPWKSEKSNPLKSNGTSCAPRPLRPPGELYPPPGNPPPYPPLAAASAVAGSILSE